jgi:hypothetical protein
VLDGRDVKSWILVQAARLLGGLEPREKSKYFVMAPLGFELI